MKKEVKVLKVLEKAYPKVKYYLDFKNPLELLVASILSAQVRDEVVNACTPSLFARYKSAESYARSSVPRLLKYIGKVSFAGSKAKHIIEACKILVKKHKGRVPRTVDELVELPGVGRKTAIVILTNAFDIVDGVVVDTHVIRLSYRLGWTKNTNPDRIERDLDASIPRQYWKKTQWLLKAHGRTVCQPIPFCSKCVISGLCPKKGVRNKL
ncbi:endonuclease III [Candidatus Woesearchaeota archaeon]|nr:endonuclease III [Candidatus Woesearchaeota archaeon]MBW3016265.1 endonuclease III [Candidatus Woesearchaeota archaeon]